MKGMLENKVAVITGAARGIGRAAAILFAKEGARVVVSDFEIKGSIETVDLIKKAGGEAVFVRADVSNSRDVKDLVEQTVRTYGRLDCAFNNAGISASGSGSRGTLRLPEEEWDRMMDVNLKGIWLCMKYEIPEMLRAGKGAIVNNSSFAGLNASRIGEVAYS